MQTDLRKEVGIEQKTYNKHSYLNLILTKFRYNEFVFIDNVALFDNDGAIPRRNDSNTFTFLQICSLVQTNSIESLSNF